MYLACTVLCLRWSPDTYLKLASRRLLLDPRWQYWRVQKYDGHTNLVARRTLVKKISVDFEVDCRDNMFVSLRIENAFVLQAIWGYQKLMADSMPIYRA